MNNLDKYKSPFKLALSMVLFYWLAFYMNWDLPKYGAIAIAVISLDTTGGSLQKGLMRILGTTFGLLFGLAMLTFFIQSRWGIMFSIAIWLTICVYYMQGSKYEYAWHVAAFMPLVILGQNYADSQYAFDYSIYRYLETCAGVLIYTTIDTLLWPKNAGEKLIQLRVKLASDIHSYFKFTSDLINKGNPIEKREDLQLSIAAGFSQVTTTFEQALTDTSKIKYNKEVWVNLQLNTKSQFNRLEMIANNVDDYKSLSEDLLQEVNRSLNSLDKLLNRIDEIGQNYLNGKSFLDQADDKELLEAIKPIDKDLISSSSRLDQMFLLNFNMQIKVFDKNSRNILTDLRILMGQDDVLDVQTDLKLKEMYRISNWQPEKLYKTLFVPLSFCIGFVIWVFINPTTGQSIPEMFGILGILVVSSKMDAHKLLLVMLFFTIALVVLIAPIYFFLMPAITTGLEILSLIFIFSFIAGMIGIKIKFLKLILLLSLYALVGITNEQTYSLFTIADGIFLLSFALVGLAAIYYVINPRTVEQNLMHRTSVFFNGCNKVIQNINVHSSELNFTTFKVKKWYYDSIVAPLPDELRGLKKNVDYKKFPENSPDDVNDLINGIQNISYKLHDLELLDRRFVKHKDKFDGLFDDIFLQLQNELSQIFTDWTQLKSGSALHDKNIVKIHKDLNKKLDILEKKANANKDNDVIQNSYLFMSGVRGLVTAMSITQKTIMEIDWSVYQEKQF